MICTVKCWWAQSLCPFVVEATWAGVGKLRASLCREEETNMLWTHSAWMKHVCLGFIIRNLHLFFLFHVIKRVMLKHCPASVFNLTIVSVKLKTQSWQECLINNVLLPSVLLKEDLIFFFLSLWSTLVWDRCLCDWLIYWLAVLWSVVWLFCWIFIFLFN